MHIIDRINQICVRYVEQTGKFPKKLIIGEDSFNQLTEYLFNILTYSELAKLENENSNLSLATIVGPVEIIEASEVDMELVL